MNDKQKKKKVPVEPKKTYSKKTMGKQGTIILPNLSSEKQSKSTTTKSTSILGGHIENSPFYTKGDIKYENNIIEKLIVEQTSLHFIDPTKESPPIEKDFMQYEPREEIFISKNALLNDHLLVIQYSEDSGTFVDSAVDTLREQLEKDGFNFRDYDENFDLRKYYDEKDKFPYTRTVTVLKFGQETGALKHIVDRDNTKRIQDALKEKDNHVVIITGLNLVAEARIAGFAPPKIHILEPGVSQTTHNLTKSKFVFDIEDPVSATISFIASFFYGVNRECFSVLIESLLEAREISFDSKEQKDNGTNIVSLKEKWHSHGDEIIRSLGITHVEARDNSWGYRFQDQKKSKQLYHYLLASYPNFVCQPLPIFTEFYFTSDESWQHYRKKFVHYIGHLVRKHLVNIDLQWLMAEFEGNRFLKRHSYLPMRYYADLIRYLLSQADMVIIVKEFISMLVNRCLNQQQVWHQTLESSEQLCTVLAVIKHIDLQDINELPEKIPELSIFIDLADLVYVTHYLIVNCFGVGAKSSIEWFSKLLQDPELGQVLLGKEEILQEDILYPLLSITKREMMDWSLAWNLQQFMMLAKTLSNELQNTNNQDNKQGVFSELAYCSLVVLLQEFYNATIEIENSDESKRFVAEMFLPEDQKENASILAEFIVTSPIRALIEELLYEERIFFTVWIASIYETFSTALLCLSEKPPQEMEYHFRPFVQALADVIKRSELAEIARIAKAKLKPYKEDLIIAKRTKDKEGYKLAQHEFDGLKMFIRCLLS